MATIESLCESGVLRSIKVRLSRREFEERKLYGTPAFWGWLQGEVRRIEPLDPANLHPKHQAHDFIRSYISGGAFNIGRTFKRMRPVERDVFEFTTPDLRIFGWFYQPSTFVAVIGDFMENTHSQPGVYDRHRDQVVRFRDEIDLDPPKYIFGATEHDLL